MIATSTDNNNNNIAHIYIHFRLKLQKGTMGCDGGTIPTRDELVKLKKKPEQRDKDGHRIFRWQHCSISQQPLRKPVMACEMGKMYNKESIIGL